MRRARAWAGLAAALVMAAIVFAPRPPRVPLPRPAGPSEGAPKRVVRNVGGAPSVERTEGEVVAASGADGEPAFLVPPQGAVPEALRPIPEEPLEGHALWLAARDALANSFASFCAVQLSMATGEDRDDDLTLEVVLDEGGLAAATLIGAEELPPALAECYAESLWGTRWPRIEGGDGAVRLELPFVVGVATIPADP